MNCVIGIDLGGTSIKGGLFSTEGMLLYAMEMSTGDRDFISICDRLALVNEELVSKVKAVDCVVGTGIGVPGGILRDRAVVHRSPNFPEWKNVNLKTGLESRGLRSITIENDANCAAFAEHKMGAGKGFNSLGLFTLGTGIGGGIILGGQLFRGCWGMAGELGHIPVFPDGMPCSCGGTGCLEQYASGSAIILAASQYWQKGQVKEWSKAPESAFEVYGCARAGNETCQKVFQKAGRALGIAISGLINALNLPLFIIGGGVGRSYDLMEESLLLELSTRTFPLAAKEVRVVQAAMGNEAGMTGAALLAAERVD